MPMVMIIGASRGIGLELARQYANDGWRVHATTRTPAQPGPLGALAGDLLVRHASATGRGIEATRTTMRHFGRRTHFHLLNDPEVYAHMRSLLEATR